MNFKKVDRMPIIEWASWWDKTIERWHTEGLPHNLTDRYEISRYFDLDIYYQDWFRPIHWTCPPPPYHGAGLISDISNAALKYEELKEFLFKIETDWPFSEKKWDKWTSEQENGDAVIWFTLDGFFWFPRKILGIENHLYGFYDLPDLMHQMNKELSDWMIQIIEKICKNYSPDFMTFAEDLSYNNGPMLSEDMFDEFMLPYYKKVIPILKKYEIKVFIDSDGNVNKAARWFEKAGIDGILPLEKQAGSDPLTIRRECPTMLFIGAFDKMKISKGEFEMRKEFESLLPMIREGGFIVSCDHQTPPQVSLENYKIYLSLLREYANLI
ncbi:MAG TPA: uroporphyrinogen decarboxylase family protein [Victivallales bacterium]|nr:uroporphyrinogen decarboxylase family protein [Victivallales bacterium]